MNRSRQIWRVFWILLATTAACATASALEESRNIGQFMHTSWGAKQGAPAHIRFITQITDGYLWLGTDFGLFRFDGVVFEHYEPPAGPALPGGSVTALLGLPNGDLWIGFYSGVITLLRNGRAENYTSHEGVPEGHLWCLAQDRQGTIWAGTNTGLARLEGNRWKKIGKEWTFPGKAAKALFVDHSGTLWVATDETLFYLPEGTRAFQPTSIQVGQVLQITQAPNGKLWMAETSRSVRPVPLAGALSPSNETEIRVGSKEILFDREDHLWITTLGDGMRRISAPEQLKGKPGRFSSALERYTTKDGLSNDTVFSIFQDHDGNIWVGTLEGLDRFRRSSFTPVPVLSAKINGTINSPGLISGEHGDMWMLLASRIFHIDKTRTAALADLFYPINSGYRNTKGTIWLITVRNLVRFENGRFYWLPFPEEVRVPYATELKIAEDGSGVLWLAAEQAGLFRHEHGGWSRVNIPPDVVQLSPTAAFKDEPGRVWFGYTGAVLVTLNEGKLQILHPKLNPPPGVVRAIQGRNKHIWIGTDSDLLLLDGGQFYAVAPTDQPGFLRVSGIEESADGSLWLCEKRGVIHINAPEVRKFLQTPSYRVRYEVFDALDGLPGIFEGFMQKLAGGTDGRLWFATNHGIVWLNPATIPSSVPPPISIRSFTADDKRFALHPGPTLPPRSQNLHIEYTALNLSSPERVRYKYKLDGIDKDWQDASVRREAFYTNLGPGKYTFHMTARNEGGEWNPDEAVLDFRIAPAWFQTIWFRSLCVCAFLFLLWMLYQLRLRQLQRQFNMTIEVRVSERTRIARELHDTLLQTFSASLLRFQSVLKMLPARPEDARQRVESAIEQASNAIAEGRDAVHQLRAGGQTTADLADSIGNFARELMNSTAAENSPEVRVQVEGTQRNLNPMIRDEAYRIAAEALRNAIRYAGAKQIEVEVRYDAEQLRLRICDNGKGIDPAVLEKGQVPGHWGLRGMRERAKLMGGNFEIWSEVGSGTEVELTVPAVSAYAKPRSR